MSGVNPQGVQVQQLQGALRRGARPRLPVALRASGCPRAATSASSTARTTRRSSSCGCTRRSSTGRSCRRTRAGQDVWDRRYREINDWERYLTDNGFKVVKIFLNLSKEEQRTRFLKRIDLPEKNWKFSAADVRERAPVGRLPARVLRDAVGHQHAVGAVVRRPGRPEVVRADLRGGGARAHADGHRSPVPDGRQGGAQGSARAPSGELEARGSRRARRPIRTRPGIRGRRGRRATATKRPCAKREHPSARAADQDGAGRT